MNNPRFGVAVWDACYATADAVAGYTGDVFLDATDAEREDERRAERHEFGFSSAPLIDNRAVIER